MSEPYILNIRNQKAREKVCAACGQKFRPNLVKDWPWKGGGKIFCSRKCAKEVLDAKQKR